MKFQTTRSFRPSLRTTKNSPNTGRKIHPFKFGIKQMRSRGDREKVSGGIGESRNGYFVGGKLLVEAVTINLNGEPLCGNFENHTAAAEG